MSIFAPATGAYWQLLESYGLDAAGIFKRAGINPESMFDAGARIPAAAIEKAQNEGAQLSGDPNFGLREAQYFRPAHLGALGFAWLASSSLRMAFARMSRFATMINDHLQIRLQDVDGGVRVLFSNSDPAANDELREQRQLAILVKCCRHIAGEKFSPRTVTLRQSEPKDSSLYFEYFRCPVEFGSELTSLLVDAESMDRRLTGSNEQLAQLNEHIVVKYLAHNDKNDIVNRCKTAIIDSLGSGTVTEADVADSLHMTTRNLHRKLQKENTSFKLLLNEVRHDLALQYIHDRSITLTEISFMLGFSEVSSFSRAFKNWTGKPPSAARAQGSSMASELMPGSASGLV
jgi:AraC-like DNA-binding protein